ncbi:bifunctional DNA primase/polymerase [Spirillospora sp. NPDC048911]|uniref:bifunctional DNA primase/polymerase n=1 Tax=Spirillospora sp. NPDC048911 TaxID=3364527 RepID=UPI00371F700E
MAVDYVTRWQWPVMVGALPPSNTRTEVVGGVLEPTIDPDRVRDWWSQWPEAGIVVPVGPGFEVVTVPLQIGQAALEVLTERGSWLGPVMSDEDTISMLVRSGQTERWTELVAVSGAGYAYAGQGQLVVLPPGSAHVGHVVRWVVPPTSANALRLPGFEELAQVVARPPVRPRRWFW